MPSIYDQLNPSQQEAVLTTEGPLLILAGAGSGKTRTLTHRIAWLLEKGVEPWHILAITFTNKAAEEMKNRVVRMTPQGDRVFVSTFHAACVRILRSGAERLGYARDFTIYDTDDSRVLMRRIIRELNWDPKVYREREILRQISSLKNKMISPSAYEETSGGYFRDRKMAELYQTYQKRLLLANAMDFDDLLLNTVRLFEENADMLEQYRDRFRYILVDEYQDTNPAQFRLVELLAKEHRNLCVVGDDDQSIYRFRGADLRNILNFESVFPETKVIRLEENYRSTKNILGAANGVIAHNTERKGKTLWSAKPVGDPVVFRQYADGREEAREIVKDIVKERARFPYGSVAVLYRTNAQSRALEEALVTAGVPYRLIGGVNFYERREVKDILSYLRLIANPNDDVSLRRIINVPRRGIGDVTLDRLQLLANEEGCSLSEALREFAGEPELKRAAAKLKEFADLMDRFRAVAASMTVFDLIEEILIRSGYKDELRQEEDELQAEARLENIAELQNKAADMGGEAGDPEALTRFLSETVLVSEVDALVDEDEKVVLMTLHSAKRLEFPKVYIAGMEQELFPNSKSLYGTDGSDLEEERRLCYVGFTRAMEKLVLTAAHSRMMNGSFATHLISQFVEEIPPEFLKEERVGFMQTRAESRRRQEEEDYYNGWSRPERGGFGKGGGSRAPRWTQDAEPFPQGGWKDFGESFGYDFGGASRKKSSDAGKMAGLVKKFRQEEAAEKKEAPEVLTEFAPGDRVVSKRFGAGTVVSAEPGKRDLEVTVDFDNYGRKVLLAGFAAFTREP